MTSLLSGTFTTPSTVKAFNLPLPSGYDYFEMYNITDIGSTAASTPVMRARGTSAMAAGSAYYSLKTNGAATLALETTTTSGGFTFFTNGNPPTFSTSTVTGITAASPAVVTTSADHGLAVGDVVIFSNLNGTMQPMNGVQFSVIAVPSSTTFHIPFDSSGAVGGTPATSGSVRKVIPSPFSPQNIVIGPTATINSGSSLLLNMCQIPSISMGASQYIPYLRPYQVGAILRLYLPSGFGTNISANFLLIRIDQINNLGGAYPASPLNTQLQCTILPGNPVGSATTAAGLGALTWPAGAAGYSGQLPYVTDIAEVVQDLSEAEDNTGKYGIIIGTTVQTASKQYQWFARKGFDQGVFSIS